MFKEITDRETILELGAAGVLWDSWYVHSDLANDRTQEVQPMYSWDAKMPVAAEDWDPRNYYLDVEGVDEEDLRHTKYRFYILIED